MENSSALLVPLLGAALCLAGCPWGDGDPFGRVDPTGSSDEETPGSGGESDDDDDGSGGGDAAHPLADCVVTHTLAYTEEANGAYWVTTSVYDEEGRLSRWDFDQDGDGVDSVQTSTYDALGQLSVVSGDVDADGIEDERWTHSYDESGQRVQSEFRRGTVVEMLLLWSYDDLGRRVLEEQDAAADGLVDGRTIWAYVGEMIQESTMEEDPDADGEADARTSYSWTADGLLLRQEWDDEADGDVDAAWDYAYDPDGHVSELVVDRDGDGLPDEIVQTEHDAQGNRSWRSEDTDADGVPDELLRWTNSYDESLRLIHVDHDAEDDGTIDAWDGWDYACPS